MKEEISMSKQNKKSKNIFVRIMAFVLAFLMVSSMLVTVVGALIKENGQG